MERASNAELDPAHYGFTAADLDRPIFIDGVLGFETASLRQIITRLQSVYCGTVGVEFMHIQSPEEKHWLQTRIEAGDLNSAYEKPKKLKILQRLMAGEEF